MRSMSLGLLVLITATASADPTVTSSADPAAAAPATTPVTRGVPQLSGFLLLDPTPPPPPPSLRIEALRVATTNFEDSWRYPAPGDLGGIDGTGWFMGAAHYRPRTARSAALHGGSIAATLVGEILIGSGSPLAGVGALLTGATLDAAAADADRDAEARRP